MFSFIASCLGGQRGLTCSRSVNVCASYRRYRGRGLISMTLFCRKLELIRSNPMVHVGEGCFRPIILILVIMHQSTNVVAELRHV